MLLAELLRKYTTERLHWGMVDNLDLTIPWIRIFFGFKFIDGWRWNKSENFLISKQRWKFVSVSNTINTKRGQRTSLAKRSYENTADYKVVLEPNTELKETNILETNQQCKTCRILREMVEPGKSRYPKEIQDQTNTGRTVWPNRCQDGNSKETEDGWNSTS